MGARHQHLSPAAMFHRCRTLTLGMTRFHCFAHPSPSLAGLPANALYAVQAVPCNASDPLQRWTVNGNGSSIQLPAATGQTAVLDAYACGTADDTLVYVYPSDNGAGTCGGKNQEWNWLADGTIRNANSGSCLDIYDYAGPSIDTYTCNGGLNQAWTVNQTTGQIMSKQAPAPPTNQPLCLAAAPADPLACTNVWGRPLVDGSWAFAMVNNGPDNITVTCDESCFGFTNMTASSLAIRDLWAHQVVANLTSAPFSYSTVVPGEGGSVIFRAIPTSAA